MIIIKKKTTKLKDFSIGKNNAKATFKNVKRIDGGLVVRCYSVDVYGKKGLKHKDLLILSDDKKNLDKSLRKMFPYVVRKDLM